MTKLVIVSDSSEDRIQVALDAVDVAERNIRKAMGEKSTNGLTMRISTGSGLTMTEQRIKHLNDILAEIQALLDRAMTKLGKVKVRFIHDLKSTEYPTDIHFFHLTDTSTQDDMQQLLRDAMAAPGEDGIARLCNMRNVRDVEVKLQSNELSDVHKDYSVLYKFLAVVSPVLNLRNPDYMME